MPIFGKIQKDPDSDFEFPVGSLVGTPDDGKTYWAIANHLEIMVIGTGKLSLLIWGGDKSTDQSAVTVQVDVEKEKAQALVQEAEEINNDLFKDRFHFQVHAYANSFYLFNANHKIPEPLLDTGMTLTQGDLLIVDVSPRDFWNLGGGGWIRNANGTQANGNMTNESTQKNYNFILASLLGTLDGGKTFFPVGTHLEMTVLNGGTLSFSCWDIDYANNAGSVKACVKVIRNGKILTHLDIKTITGTGSDGSSETGTGTSTGTTDYSNLDCSANLPKLSTQLKSDLSAAK
ncbi:hypothetical protein [Coleofasciculus sp.]|uniref:hypothetical protein n=1 Tax=Coleofasciculus sp. TaxID=3100458 RepID=UPI0039F894D1